jgi:hypothetical protein
MRWNFEGRVAKAFAWAEIFENRIREVPKETPKNFTANFTAVSAERAPKPHVSSIHVTENTCTRS